MSDDRAHREVRVAGRPLVVEKFSTRKVTRTLKLIGDVATRWQEVNDRIAEFRERYAESRKVVWTRDMVAVHMAELASEAAAAEDAEQRAELEATAAHYKRLLDGPLKDKESIEQPRQPSFEEVLMAIAPGAFENAEEEVTRLLGLAVMTNADVGAARKAGNLDEEIFERGNDLLDTTDLDEALEILAAGAEMLLGDIGQRRERLGKIVALFRTSGEGSQEAEAEAEARRVTEAILSETPTTPTPSTPTTSGEPTDGPPSTASTSSPTPTPVGTST